MTVEFFRSVGEPTITRSAVGGFSIERASLLPTSSTLPRLSINDPTANFVVSNYSNTTVPAAQNALLDAIDTILLAGENTLTVDGGTYELLNCDLNNRPISLIGNTDRTGSNPVIFKAVGRPLTSPTTATSVFRKGGSDPYLRNLQLKNLIIDGNSGGQSALAGSVSAIQCGGIVNAIFDNILVKDGINYAVFYGGKGGLTPIDTGTVDFVQGSNIVSGTSTSFTSFVTVGFPLRSSSGEESAEVINVIDNNTLVLAYPWVHSSETGVGYVSVEPNNNFVMRNCEFQKSGADDLFGGGFWYNGTISDCIFEDGFGYGLGGTAAAHLIIRNCIARGNRQGFGFERFYNCTITNNIAYNNSDNGFYLINGTAGCYVAENESYNNGKSGFAVGLVWIPAAPKIQSSDITYFRNKAYNNEDHGFRVGGASRISFNEDEAYNNGQGASGRYGFVVTDTSRSPLSPSFSDSISFINCRAYDDQAIKTQEGGALINTGSTNILFQGGDYRNNKTISINDLTGSASISPSTQV